MPLTKQQEFQKELQNYFWENGLTSEVTKTDRLAYFAHLVTEKNKEINLISKNDIENVLERHVFISAYITKFFPDKISKFIDIGTGGGFPGIPIAIMRPDLRGILVDSTAKKVDAVREFIDKLKLSNIIAENYRVESDEFIEKYKEQFDMVVSRATVPLIILIRYALPLVKEKAYVVSVKGGDLNEEFAKAEMKYKTNIKKSTVYELAYKPNNPRNEKGKKLIVIELQK
ncbi:MAG: 16S rRNA (guanine(527)-N(7))-methyltransferase RsmG [Ignavibacterium sp.]|nr:16S rRNA (guanine(527)-N(7))-methyltransferase RsmG [Ignavibacterium sp.]MCX7611254.1 16S rRNA (guanine(527)-N(7))-methyltransferase RsmG [Ignavibacterium sp.]MDW8375254.1 16S rRNA (guanine(527)-N(7))-methyltransferase RsmG [Ignavibacteriales bacterium]